MLGDLTDSQISNILSTQVIGRLACTDGKFPYIVPVTFAYDGKYIYGQANEGEKLKIIRKNHHVCFEVEMMTEMTDWQCVLVFGEFEELKGEDAEKAREILYNRVYTLRTSSTIHAHEHGGSSSLDDSNREKHIMYRIMPGKVTGRFERR